MLLMLWKSPSLICVCLLYEKKGSEAELEGVLDMSFYKRGSSLENLIWFQRFLYVVKWNFNRPGPALQAFLCFFDTFNALFDAGWNRILCLSERYLAENKRNVMQIFPLKLHSEIEFHQATSPEFTFILLLFLWKQALNFLCTVRARL